MNETSYGPSQTLGTVTAVHNSIHCPSMEPSGPTLVTVTCTVGQSITWALNLKLRPDIQVGDRVWVTVALEPRDAPTPQEPQRPRKRRWLA